jgi:hypothetical protein
VIEFDSIEDIHHVPELEMSLQDIMEALPSPVELKRIKGFIFYLYKVSDGYWIIQKNPDLTFFVSAGDKLDLIFKNINDSNKLYQNEGGYIQ